MALHKLNSDCRYVYLVGVRRGKTVFLADAEPVNSSDHSPPGRVYSAQTRTLTEGRGLVIGPATHAWGASVSGIVPICDPATNRAAAVLGMDVDADYWLNELAARRRTCILIVFLACCGTVAFLAALQSKEDSSAQVAASERRYRSLVENAADMLLLHDTAGKIIDVNQAACDCLGYTREELLGMSISEIETHFNYEYLIGLWQRLTSDRSTTVYGIQRRKDGSTFAVEVHLGRYESNESGYVIALARDITERKLTQKALKESEEKYRALFECVADPVFLVDTISGEIVDMNGAAVRVYGYSRDEMLQMKKSELSVEPNGKTYPALADTRYAPIRCHRKKDSTIFVVEISTGYTVLGGREVQVSAVRDITERKHAEANLRLQASAINAASDQIVITNTDGEIEFVNAAFERETGYLAKEVLGRNPRVLKSGKHDEEYYHDLWNTIQAGLTWHGEVVNCNKDGTLSVEDMTITPVRDEAGTIEHFVAIKRNITEKKIYEERLDHLAHHDSLTGLPNRLLFSNRLSQNLAESSRRGSLLAVMFIDLDCFKLINDTLGHNSGDILLREVAGRLTGYLREVDTIARMGGDEFTVILSDVAGSQGAANVAQRILETLAAPFNVSGHELFVSGSIGISMYPEDGTDVETLVKNADTAMYRAKEHGRNNYQFYTKALNTAAMARMTLESSLRKALDREEFLVHYQPLVDIKSGEILGVEALVRWQHPDVGLVSPAQFIPLAEETGLIIPISEWVLHEACAQNKAWQDAGLPPIDVAVNISARHFEQKGLLETVSTTLTQTGLHPEYLGLELTESALMQSP